MAPWSPERLKRAADDVLQIFDPGRISSLAWHQISDVLDQWFISEKTDAHRAAIQPLLNNIGFANLDLSDDEVVRQNMVEQHAAARERENVPRISPISSISELSEPNSADNISGDEMDRQAEAMDVDQESAVEHTEEPTVRQSVKGLPVYYLGESNMVFTNGARLYHLLRNAIAAADEGALCRIASAHKNFVRGSELAQIDCGVFVSRSAPDIRDMTDRFFHYFDNSGTSKVKNFIPIEIKSIAPRPSIHTGFKLHTIKRFLFTVKFLPEQFTRCEWVFFTSVADPTVVAPFPMHNLRMMSNVEDGQNRVYQFPRMSLDMVYATAIPPELMWAEMPRSMLPAFIESLLQFTLGEAEEIINPFSDLPYFSLPPMNTSPFPLLLTTEGVNEKELILKRKIWHAFKVHGSASRLSVKLPESAPFTSDLEIVHASGISIFIELKQGLCKIRNVRGGGLRLSHSARNVGVGRPIFTFAAVWDYILTELNDGTAVFLSKDEVLKAWWHKDPGNDNMLEWEFPDRNFVDAHKVDLTDEQLIVVQIGRIVRGPNSAANNAPPLKAKISASDIMRIAGPVPSSLLPFKEMEIAEEEDGDAEQQLQDAVEWGIKWQSISDLYPNMQRARTGGDDLTFESMFFNAVMYGCRHRKQGLIVDLGPRHPLGRFGFLPWEWSTTDCELFDLGIAAPARMGNLESAILILPLVVAWTPCKHGVGPLEPTRSAFDAIKLAKRCIVVLDGAWKIDGHVPHDRWVVPSEFIPDHHQGRLRGLPTFRGKLFLKGKRPVEEFTCAESELIDTFYAFFEGNAMTEVGLSSVQVDGDQYLTNVGICKESACINFSSMARVGGTEDDADDED